MPIDDVTDLDWYLDNVVVPSGPQRRAVGPVRAWQGWWLARAHLLRSETGLHDTAVGHALAQGFVLSWAEARQCGVPNATIRRLVRQGTWHSVGRGWVAVLPAAELGADSRLARRRLHALQATAAATRRTDHTVAASSAAVLHGLPLLTEPTSPGLAAAAGTTFGRRECAQVHRWQLDADEVEMWFGVPVTSPARTIVDLARADRRSGLMASDAALHEGIVTTRALDDALRNSTGLPGVQRARAVLSLAEPLIESPLESLTNLALHDSGFPPPQPQCWLTGADGKRYRVDFLWREYRLALEADGRAKNSEAERWREKKRDLALERAGYRVVRVTWRDVVHDWPTVERLLRGLMTTDRSQ